MVWWLVRCIALRRAFKTPLRSLLLLASVGFTVCLFVSVFYASRAAVESFERSSVVLGPQVDIYVGKKSGYLHPPDYRPLAVALSRTYSLIPTVEVPIVFIAANKPVPLLVSGIDGFGLLSKYVHDDEAHTAADGLFFTREFAQRYALEPGSRISITFGDTQREILVAGLVDSGEVGVAESAVLADLLFVHELLGQEALSSLGLVRHSAPDLADEVLRQARASFPDLVFSTMSEKREQARELVSAFRTNLGIMLLITFIVMIGAVFGAAQLSVLSITKELSILELLGLSRKDGIAVVTGETILLGSLGSLLGATLGVPVARLIARSVLGTAEAFYLPHRATSLGDLGWQVQSIGLLAGIGGTCIGAFLPLMLSNRSLLSVALRGGLIENEGKENVTGLLKAVLLFVPVLVTSLILYAAFSIRRLELAYISSAAVLLTLAVLSPYGMPLLAQLLRGVAVRSGVSGLIAWGHLRSWQRVSSLSARLLSVATALLCGLGILLTSFQLSLEEWVGVRFQADLFIRPLATGTLEQPAYLSPQSVSTVQELLPDASLFMVSRSNEKIEGEYLALVGSTYGVDDSARFYVFLDGGLPTSAESSAALLSESASRRLQKRVGESIDVRGEAFLVTGIYRDFTTERGEVTLSLDVYRRITEIQGVESLSVTLPKGVTSGQAAQRLREGLDGAGIRIATNSELRDLIRKLFRDTFSITLVVRAAVTILCIAAFLLAIIQQTMERRVEIGHLLKIGVSPGEFSGAVALESFLTAVPAALLGGAGGIVLAYILVGLVNPLSFGWSLTFHLHVSEIVIPLLFICGGTVCAGAAIVFVGVRSLLGELVGEEE